MDNMPEWMEQVNGDGYYSVYKVRRSDAAMSFLRERFPDGEADDLNFVLFSTSGVHGHSCLIEKIELANENEDAVDDVTFLLIQPRTVTMVYGQVKPETSDDIKFLKKLRASSKEAISDIGEPINGGMKMEELKNELMAVIAKYDGKRINGRWVFPAKVAGAAMSELSAIMDKIINHA